MWQQVTQNSRVHFPLRVLTAKNIRLKLKFQRNDAIEGGKGKVLEWYIGICEHGLINFRVIDSPRGRVRRRFYFCETWFLLQPRNGGRRIITI